MYSASSLFGEVVAEEQLCFERALQLILAVKNNQEYTLLEARRKTNPDNSIVETLIVEARVDAVPPKNIQGIKYPEPLALLVPQSDTSLVEVYVLREDFPKHLQHQTAFFPVSLICLYLDPIESILRQWTPQNFLRRISWWFAKTANNEIHPEDQPLELPFYKSNFELILPWDFEKIRNDSRAKFLLASHGPRGIEQTFSLINKDQFPPEEIKPGKSPDLFFLDVLVPAIVHKSPIFFRQTLGELSVQLNEIGIDLISNIRNSLANELTSEGVSDEKKSIRTVVFLQVPIKRDESSEIESVIQRPFFLCCDWLNLGEQVGAFICHQDGRSKKYYLDSLGPGKPLDQWQQIPVFQMELKKQLSPEICRDYSGVNEAGPKGVLIGVGALGSKLIELWSRNGWGVWTVIDSDHISPHNLSRHTAESYDIGNYKVNSVADSVQRTFNGATAVTPIAVDVLKEPYTSYSMHLEPAQLIIDATTTLDYPRKVSAIDSLPRHASVFLTPDGNSSVLMLESFNRDVRLRTLEAQYYRALINLPWGIDHFGDTVTTFQSGGSCRDVSLVMPYSKIIAHAATLSEQLQTHSATPEAVLWVWSRTPDGAVVAHQLPTYKDRLACSSTLDVYVDAGLEEKLQALRSLAFPNETGGVLVGYFDFRQKIAVIVDALPPPPDSESTPTSFQRGEEGVLESLAKVQATTLGNVNYIGEWHTHPENHSAQPSVLDLKQISGLALSMAVDGLPALSLIVGDPEIKVLIASVGYA